MSLKDKLIKSLRKAVANQLSLKFKPDQDLDIHKYHNVYELSLGKYNIQAEIVYGRTIAICMVDKNGAVKAEIDRDDIPLKFDEYLISIMTTGM